jgi:hypothetical protein
MIFRDLRRNGVHFCVSGRFCLNRWINLSSIRSIKVVTITGLLILGIVLDLGGGPSHDRIGFRYWKNPGPFVQFDGIAGAKGRFLGFVRVLLQAAFSFIGTEVVTVCRLSVIIDTKFIIATFLDGSCRDEESSIRHAAGDTDSIRSDSLILRRGSFCHWVARPFRQSFVKS